MMLKRNAVLVVVGAVALGLLSVVCLAALLGLGIAGILVAQDLNLCQRSNVTNECVFFVSLDTSLNDTDPTSLVAPDVSRELDWAYYLAGSTAVSVLWALVTLLAMLLVVEVLRDKQKGDFNRLSEKTTKPPEEMGGKAVGASGVGPEEVPMVELGAGAEGASGVGPVEDAGVRRGRLSGVDEPDKTKGVALAEEKEEIGQKLVTEAGIPKKHLRGRDEHDHYEVEKDYIGAYRVREWRGKALRHLGWSGSVTFLFCLLCLALGLECVLWAVALGYYHTNRLEKNISAFVLVEFLVGLLLPLLLFVASVLLAIVLDYVTIGRVDARMRIKRFLPSVTFEEGLNYDYWVIEDLFYFRLEKRDKHLAHRFSLLYSCDKTLSTWLLTGIVAISILLCLSYFVDVTVVEQDTRTSCPVDTGLYDCFNKSSFNFVDCADEEVRGRVELIHCFRFLRFAVDTNLISSLALTFAFYLATVAVFGHVFSAVKTVLHLHRSRNWGVAFIVVGGAAFVLTVVFLGIEDRFQIQVNFLSVMQVCMVCLFLVLVGVLVLRGDWFEKIFDHKRVTPIAELLLRYNQISNAELQQIEHNYAVEIKREDPTSKHVVEMETHTK